MMIEASRVLRMVRQKEQDNDAVKYSDYDIEQAINEVIRYLSIDLAHKDSEYLRHSKDYDEAEMNAAIDSENEASASTEGYTAQAHVAFWKTGVELPDGFTSLVSVQRGEDHYNLHPATSLAKLHEREYVLYGGRIYVKHRAFRLNYIGAIPEIKDFDTESIELPPMFLDSIVKLTRLVLNNGDADTLTQAISAAVDTIIPRRRLSNVRQKMPFWM